MFRSPLKPSSGGPRLYFARLLNWNVDLHSLKKCPYVAVCRFILCVCVCVCVCVGTYLVETMAFSILKCSKVHELEQ